MLIWIQKLEKLKKIKNTKRFSCVLQQKNKKSSFHILYFEVCISVLLYIRFWTFFYHLKLRIPNFPTAQRSSKTYLYQERYEEIKITSAMPAETKTLDNRLNMVRNVDSNHFWHLNLTNHQKQLCTIIYKLLVCMTPSRLLLCCNRRLHHYYTTLKSAYGRPGRPAVRCLTLGCHAPIVRGASRLSDGLKLGIWRFSTCWVDFRRSQSLRTSLDTQP